MTDRQDAEIRLAEAYRTTIDGAAGSVVMLSGAAGIGKTHIAERFLGQHQTAVRFSADASVTGGPPLLPICAALTKVSNITVHEAIRSTLYEYAQSVPVLKEAFGPMFRVHKQVRLGAGAAPDVAPKETHTFFVLYEMLRRIREKAVAMLFLDDIQWLDASSVSFLGFLADHLKQLPMFVLLAGRSSGSDPPTLKSLRLALAKLGTEFHDVALSPLTHADVVAVASRYLRAEFDGSTQDADWLLRSSGGNPKYLQEVLSMLQESGEISVKQRRWRLDRRSDGLQLPASYRELVRERLGMIASSDPEVEAALHLAAVIGGEIDCRLVARLTGRTTQATARTLSLIQTKSSLLQRIDSTTRWKFDHELTREAILSELGELSADLHRSVADCLRGDTDTHPSRVAFHYCQAGAWKEGARFYQNAAEFAALRFAYSEAVSATERATQALSRAPDASLQDRLALARLQMDALIRAQQFPMAVETFRHFDPTLRADPGILLHAGHALLNQATQEEHAASIEFLHAAIDRSTHASDAEFLARAYADLVVAYESVGDRTNATKAFGLALQHARLSQSSQLIVRLLLSSCIFWQPAKVIEATTHALKRARESGLVFAEAQCLNNLGTQLWYLEQLPQAEESFRQTVATLEKHAGSYRIEVPWNNLAIIAMARSQLDDAQHLLNRAEQRCQVAGDRILIRCNLAVCHAMASDVATATSQLFVLRAEADSYGDPFHRDIVRQNLARALLIAGRAKDAIRVATEAPSRRSGSDDELVADKRNKLIRDAYNLMHDDVGASGIRPPNILDRTTKQQAWLYRSPWEITDLQFWQD